MCLQWREGNCHEASETAFIITAYKPSLDIFEPDYRTRKRP